MKLVNFGGTFGSTGLLAYLVKHLTRSWKVLHWQIQRGLPRYLPLPHTKMFLILCRFWKIQQNHMLVPPRGSTPLSTGDPVLG